MWTDLGLRNVLSRTSRNKCFEAVYFSRELYIVSSPTRLEVIGKVKSHEREPLVHSQGEPWE